MKWIWDGWDGGKWNNRGWYGTLSVKYDVFLWEMNHEMLLDVNEFIFIIGPIVNTRVAGKNEKTPNVRGTKILTERSRWRPRPTYLKSPKLSLIIQWSLTCAEFEDSRNIHLYSSRSRQMSQLQVLNIRLTRTSLAACCWDRRAVRSQSLSIWYGCLASRYTAHFPAVESRKFYYTVRAISIQNKISHLSHLHVKMNDFHAMNILHRLTNLSYKARAGPLCQYKVFVDDSFEKLAALNSAGRENTTICQELAVVKMN